MWNVATSVTELADGPCQEGRGLVLSVTMIAIVATPGDCHCFDLSQCASVSSISWMPAIALALLLSVLETRLWSHLAA